RELNGGKQRTQLTLRKQLGLGADGRARRKLALVIRMTHSIVEDAVSRFVALGDQHLDHRKYDARVGAKTDYFANRESGCGNRWLGGRGARWWSTGFLAHAVKRLRSKRLHVSDYLRGCAQRPQQPEERIGVSIAIFCSQAFARCVRPPVPHRMH